MTTIQVMKSLVIVMFAPVCMWFITGAKLSLATLSKQTQPPNQQVSNDHVQVAETLPAATPSPSPQLSLSNGGQTKHKASVVLSASPTADQTEPTPHTTSEPEQTNSDSVVSSDVPEPQSHQETTEDNSPSPTVPPENVQPQSTPPPIPTPGVAPTIPTPPSTSVFQSNQITVPTQVESPAPTEPPVQTGASVIIDVVLP